MQSAFAFDAKKTQLLIAADFVNRACCVVVTDTQVAVLPQWVIGQIVTLQILVHVPVTPIRDWVYLPALIGPLKKLRIFASDRL